ncbi:MAG: hypothetical protein JXM69_11920 [Anaerolineae bacterium]|nr:hypothetical protein [Anaerolineae bacterium]
MGEYYSKQRRGLVIALLLTWLLGIILILPEIAPTPGHVLAQGSKNTTVYLPLGEQRVMDVSFATMNQWGEEYEIYVYRQDGGSLGGWDDERWYEDTQASPPGESNVAGAMSEDGTYVWFEFRKALNSGDDYDWSWRAGDTVPDVGEVWLGAWGTTNIT